MRASLQSPPPPAIILRPTDYILPVEIDGKMVDVYVLKRPFMDHFMESVGARFEVVVFTASLAKYADPLLDLLDKQVGRLGGG